MQMCRCLPERALRCNRTVSRAARGLARLLVRSLRLCCASRRLAQILVFHKIRCARAARHSQRLPGHP